MKAVFLDRDGTLIVDPPDLRVDSIAKLHLFPDTLKAMKLLSTLDYGVILVTNQVGIAEGRITEDDFHRLNSIVIELLESSGVKILKTYFCPHGMDEKCECRKPKPKMLLQAAKEFDIDMKQSYIVGDRVSDVEAGLNAKTKAILVKTGNEPVSTDKATYTAADILEAIEYIARNSKLR